MPPDLRAAGAATASHATHQHRSDLHADTGKIDTFRWCLYASLVRIRAATHRVLRRLNLGEVGRSEGRSIRLGYGRRPRPLSRQIGAVANNLLARALNSDVSSLRSDKISLEKSSDTDLSDSGNGNFDSSRRRRMLSEVSSKIAELTATRDRIINAIKSRHPSASADF